MPNYVHWILVPSDETGLSRAVGETHRRFSGYINARLRVTGHLFQGRFGCVAMDESHLMAAFRYVALNPVRAKLAATAADWPWSSAPAHLRRENDDLVTVRPLLDRVDSFAEFLEVPADPERIAALTNKQDGCLVLLLSCIIVLIEGHLAHYVGRGELPVTDVVDDEKLARITAVLEEMGDNELGPVKQALGDDCSYGEIKMVRAHVRRKR